jgi:hypothetical protein
MTTHRVRATFTASLAVLALASAHATISLSPKWISADGIVFAYPELLDASQKPAGTPIETTVEGETARLKYDAGMTANLSVSGDQLTIVFAKIKPGAKSFKLAANIDPNRFLGATWKAGEGVFAVFPESKPAKPHLFQGQIKQMAFEYASGKGQTLAFPPFAYVQLTDTREWGWKNFALSFNSPLNPDNPRVTMSSRTGDATTETGEPVARKFLVDKFGQYAVKDWPGKLTSEDELKSDVEADKAYYESFTPPESDRYGGLPGSKEKYGFNQTGFFHVEKKGDRWYLVNPDGNWQFHLGVCGIAVYPINVEPKGRESTFEWLPPYEGPYQTAFGQNGGGGRDGKVNFFLVNRIKKYGVPFDNKAYTAEMIHRVRKFGFNGAGAFGGGDADTRKEALFPIATELPLRSYQGIQRVPGPRETWDPFDEKVRAEVDKKLSRLARSADDPLVIGYYYANEPTYEDIPRVVPTFTGESAAKRRLVQMLQEKYGATADFNKAWGLDLASFDEATHQGLAVKTRAASDDMAAFTSLFLEEYYKFTSETFRRYDKNHMLIGSRLQSGTINNEELCRIGAKYSDIWSFNYYTYGLDEAFLAKIHAWTGGKPMILSEFHWNSASDSGVQGGAKDVGSQRERGLGYRHYVEQAASLPYIVGTEWYMLLDGAVGGFNANCGLINIVDRPWTAMIAEMVKTNYEIYKVAAGERSRFVFDDPKFAGKGGNNTILAERVAKPLVIDGQGGDWPGIPAERIGANRLVQGSSAEGLEAAVKVSWDEEYLYVIADVVDATPMMNRQSGVDLWNADAVEVFVGVEETSKGGPLLFTDRHLLMSAAANGSFHFVHSAEQYAATIAVSAKAGSGYILEAAIPWTALTHTPATGQELLFDLGIDGSEDGTRRTQQLMWNGTLKNSGDRTHWGTLRLVGGQ